MSISDLTPEELESFPDIELYRKNIEYLKTTDFSTFSQEEISKQLLERAIVLPSVFGVQIAENFNTQTFYRVRLEKTFAKEEDKALIRTYSYPSPHLCKYNGRANVKGKSVFYSSNVAPAAILETRPEVGDVGFLSVWKANANRSVKYGAFLRRDITEENPYHVIAKDIYSYFDRSIVEYHSGHKNHLTEVYDFISGQFTEEKDPYPLTSFIATNNLYGDTWKDFIIYPSIANQLTSCNFAFHPNAADRFLSFESVIRFKIISTDPLRFTTGKVGKIVNNDIEWQTGEENDFSMFGAKVHRL